MPDFLTFSDAPNRRYHQTISRNLDLIFDLGLLPNAKKLFGLQSPTPSMGGVYYTINLLDIPNILRNMGKTGVLCRNDLAILSFDNNENARVDEDDWFRVVYHNKNEYEVTHIGSEYVASRDVIACVIDSSV